MKKERWLIIKLGALGDMVQVAPFCHKLRANKPDAHITILTTPIFADWVKGWGCFDDVWAEKRFTSWRLDRLLYVMWRIRSFDRVVDLQGVDRTRLYTFSKAESISTKHDMHPRWRLQMLADQLELGELGAPKLPETSDIWRPSKPYVLLVPGASKAKKCWPEKNFCELSAWLQKQGLEVMVIGKDNFQEPLKSLTCETTWDDIVTLGHHAAISIGNDTGPQLLASAGGCPTLTFYSDANPPTRGGPWGGLSLYSGNLADLTLDEVISFLEEHSSLWKPNPLNI